MLKHITGANFDEEVLAQDGLVLVDFWAEWCAPCKALAPALDALAEDYKDAVSIVKLDIDKNANTRDRFGIRGIPALLLFKEGKEAARLVGMQTRGKLREFLDSHLGRDPASIPNPAANAAPARAFGGDPVRKQACIARLEEYIGREAAQPGVAMGEGSPLEYAAGAAAEAAAAVLDVPLSLILAVDSLATCYGTSVAGAEFVLAWLREIPVGADLSILPRDLLLAVLNSKDVCAAAALEAGFSDLRKEIVSAHCKADGVAEWSVLREAAGKQIVGTGQLLRALGTCLQNACWPCTEADMLRQTVMSATFLPAIKISLEMEWSQTEAMAMEELLKRHGEVLIAERRSPREAWDLAFRENPQLAERYKQHSFRYHDAMREYGQFVGRSLLALTRTATPS